MILLAEVMERIASGETKIENIVDWMNLHENKQNTCLEKIEQRLEKIEQKLDGRPPWAVSVLITFFSALCVGLLVYIAK